MERRNIAEHSWRAGPKLRLKKFSTFIFSVKSSTSFWTQFKRPPTRRRHAATFLRWPPASLGVGGRGHPRPAKLHYLSWLLFATAVISLSECYIIVSEYTLLLLQFVCIGVNRAISAPGNNIHILQKSNKSCKIREEVEYIIFLSYYTDGKHTF